MRFRRGGSRCERGESVVLECSTGGGGGGGGGCVAVVVVWWWWLQWCGVEALSEWCDVYGYVLKWWLEFRWRIEDDCGGGGGGSYGELRIVGVMVVKWGKELG